MYKIIVQLFILYLSFMLIDAHSHIQISDKFPDLDDVFSRAKESNVLGQMIVGYNYDVSLDAVDLVKRFLDEKLWVSLGVHPYDASSWNDDVRDGFIKLIKDNDFVVAIGEIGLDYFRNLTPKDLQKDVFIKQLELAMEFDLPAVLHIRDAMDDAFNVLDEIPYKKIVLHSFNGSMEQAKRGIEAGYYFSFSGMITYPKNDYLRDIVKIIPEDRILVETDCPYLPPQKFRGKRNEPAFVREVALTVADVRGVGIEDVERFTTDNFMRLFVVK